MASALSKKQEVELLNHMFGKSEATKPTEYWVALTTVEPTRDMESKNLTEPGYTGYARLLTKPSEWESATEGAGAAASFIQNSSVLTFAACTAGETTGIKWAAIVRVAKVSESGVIIGWGELGSSLTVSTTFTPVRFESKELKITAF
jgi:hypothetical protein